MGNNNCCCLDSPEQSSSKRKDLVVQNGDLDFSSLAGSLASKAHSKQVDSTNKRNDGLTYMGS